LIYYTFLVKKSLCGSGCDWKYATVL